MEPIIYQNWKQYNVYGSIIICESEINLKCRLQTTVTASETSMKTASSLSPRALSTEHLWKLLRFWSFHRVVVKRFLSSLRSEWKHSMYPFEIIITSKFPPAIKFDELLDVVFTSMIRPHIRFFPWQWFSFRRSIHHALVASLAKGAKL